MKKILARDYCQNLSGIKRNTDLKKFPYTAWN